MSDYDGEFDSAPNYEKMRGMGFICWREIPGTNDNEENDDAQVTTTTKKKKKDNKRKIDAVETEQEIETPKKKKNKKKKKKNKRSNTTNATSALQLTNENKPSETETNTDQDAIENATKIWTSLCVPENIVQSLVEQKFFDPTPIQRLTLPAAIRDRLDIIGAAETGSGKTLAFAIPILTHMSRLLESNEMAYEQFTALILTPTRELAVQIKSHIQIACRYTKFKTAVVVGGMSTQKQQRQLSQKPEIIVATPGRFWELLEENNSHITDMSNLRFLAIDETDRMIEKGHFDELEKILSLLNNDDTNQTRQKFVFSATLLLQPDTNDNQKKSKKTKKKDDNQDKLTTLISAVGINAKPKIIDLTKQFGLAETLTEARVNCSLEEKDLYLYYFLTLYPGRTLIFTNSIDCIKRLQSVLAILKRNPLPLHAQMEQKQRLTNLERFSRSDNGLLIATDVAARGLDIPNIKHIIHYQVPRSTELYVHRSGRTARAEREGLSVMFICPEELFLYRKIIKTLNRDEDLQTFPIEAHYLSSLKRRVRLAADISKLHHQVAKVANETNWYHKAAKELDIELDDNIRDIEKAKQANTKNVQTKEMQLRHELDLLLKQPLQYTSALNVSRSYPLLFGDPDQLASRRKNDMTALEELKHRS